MTTHLSFLRHDIIAGMAQQRLENYISFGVRKFSLQGLGMLRLKMRNGLRLHVWSPKHAWVKDAVVHSHPWDFEGYIACGQIRNTRFTYADNDHALAFKRRLITCGEGSCAIGDEELVHLQAGPAETYTAGQVYGQEANEIHLSVATPGTVTIIQRKGDTGQANVFYQNEWDSAEPRYPTVEELSEICTLALEVLKAEGHGDYRV